MDKPTARLYSINIPFQFAFVHATQKRNSCDSLILQISDGKHDGFGEILMREYVTGLPDSGKPLIDIVADSLQLHLANLNNQDFGGELSYLADTGFEKWENPIICGIETALLELECRRRGCDIYDLLGKSPMRETIRYGIILPVLPPEQARKLLLKIKENAMENVRLKLTTDAKYNEFILSETRQILGPGVRIVGDANRSWAPGIADRMLGICKDLNVTFIEDPFMQSDITALARNPITEEFIFIADEAFATGDDLEHIVKEGFYKMLNIRLAKNGGLLRSLSIVDQAEIQGLDYCLGCHPGETGILSALGRVAASLMPKPHYVEGSYDKLLLTGNIVDESLEFGIRGDASIIKNHAVGFNVCHQKLKTYATKTMEVWESD